ncbi:MAG: TIGR02281 family clan AA aspartic protease [Proteobacteria bacterium]|nr:TIGR02281 family clan AA aspartic protease [Pseudomonadota bacterium]
MTGRASKLLAAAAAALALFVLVVFLLARFPEAMEDGAAKPILVHQILLLVFVGAGLIVHWRARPGKAIGQAALWLAIAGLLFAGYGFRDEAAAVWNRLAGELLPHRGVQRADGSITFAARKGGHFVVEADVDGVAIRFLVDTGASHVILSAGDARRLGYDLAALDYTRAYRTAGGTVFGAPVVLGAVTIGPIRMDGVQASVSAAAMGRSLLGMSFLNRLSGYRVAGGRLTLQAPR